MAAPPGDVAAALEELREAGMLRELRVVESATGARIVLDGREVVLLCSNDYLGLAGHPAVRAAAGEAAERWGAGAGASRLISGNLAPHRELERELAAFKGTEACVLFGSGYLANTGVIAALAGTGEVVLSDALNHASIVDGCRLARAETVVYPHADLDALATALERTGGRRATIVTDAVFSMDGELAPLAGIVELAQRHGARVVVDEAHATGVVGAGGRGLVAELGLTDAVDAVVGTLGKALGSYGAFVTCRAAMAELLVNRARTLIYSTALPPPAVGAARAALGIVAETPELVAQLHANARTLRTALAAEGFMVDTHAAADIAADADAAADVAADADADADAGARAGAGAGAGAGAEMPIVPLLIGDPEPTMALCEQALADGVFAQGIRPPTVPAGTCRLRLVAMASHTPEDLCHAARVLGAAARRG